MYLILAECENELGNPAVAKLHLLEVARRDLAISDTNFDAVLATDEVAVRKFIRDERVRELMLEGHRLFDMRRYGVLPAGKNPGASR